MCRVSAILGDHKPSASAMVQRRGRALRLRTRLLRREMRTDARVQRLLPRYAQAVLSYLAQSAVCSRLHLVEQRSARWLLGCHDLADAGSLPMSRELLALRLRARRPGLSLA